MDTINKINVGGVDYLIDTVVEKTGNFTREDDGTNSGTFHYKMEVQGVDTSKPITVEVYNSSNLTKPIDTIKIFSIVEYTYCEQIEHCIYMSSKEDNSYHHIMKFADTSDAISFYSFENEDNNACFALGIFESYYNSIGTNLSLTYKIYYHQVNKTTPYVMNCY